MRLEEEILLLKELIAEKRRERDALNDEIAVLKDRLRIKRRKLNARKESAGV